MRAKTQNEVPGLTDTELVVLGLVAERPKHGYQVETAIRGRRLRAWTAIGFSSIYHALNKLRRMKLLRDTVRYQAGDRAQRVYTATRAGMQALRRELQVILAQPTRAQSRFELAIMFAHFLPLGRLLAALQAFDARVTRDIKEERRLRQEYRSKPYPVWTDLIFSHSVEYLKAQQRWTRQALERLRRFKKGKRE